MSRVSLHGGQPHEVRMRALAWRRSGFEVADDGDVFDLLDPDPTHASSARAKGVSLLVCPTPELPGVAGVGGPPAGLLGVALPWQHWPPLLRLIDRVRSRTIGAVSMARCRSLVPAAHGDGILAREIFEKAALVASLLGPVQEVFTQAPRAEPPSTTLVTFKHAGRARYSALEVTIVPAVTHASRDDSIELTGSAGVAWLRGGPGRAREPALEIHRGDRLHREAAEACWQDAVDGCVAGFAASLRSGSQPCLAPALHAAAVTVAALASARDGQRHVTNGGPA